MEIPAASTPVVCDMATAPDTPQQRLDEYRHLFDRHLIDREKTGQGIRFRLRAEPGVAAWVRDLAAREKACCAFFAFDITVEGEQVLWDCAVSDNDTARAILEEYYLLPDTAPRSPGELEKRLAGKGLKPFCGAGVAEVNGWIGILPAHDRPTGRLGCGRPLHAGSGGDHRRWAH